MCKTERDIASRNQRTAAEIHDIFNIRKNVEAVEGVRVVKVKKK